MSMPNTCVYIYIHTRFFQLQLNGYTLNHFLSPPPAWDEGAEDGAALALLISGFSTSPFGKGAPRNGSAEGGASPSDVC